MKRSTRNLQNAASKQNEKSDISNKPEPNTSLSQFKFEPKKKVSSKRTHVQIEYDEQTIKKSAHLVEKSFTSDTPKHWEQVLHNLREMRKKFDAPVDTMGCDQCADDDALPEDQRLQSLISLMLSSQTKDQVNYAAMSRLKKHGCNLSEMVNISQEKLSELIHPVNFYKTKAKNIKLAAAMIRDEFNGDIPKTVQDLCKLPGVGPKMAHLCMKTAWGEISGIAVDTHVHRITNRLGWVKTKTPENTRKALEAWLPRELWDDLNLLLVGFGQQTCQPLKPKCHDCLNNDLCPTGIAEVKSKKKKKTEK